MSEARFFFALPRLIQWWRGRDAVRSEKNAIEANAVGISMNVVAFAFGFVLCLTSRPLWQQLLCSVPLVFVVWIFWLNLVYLDSLAIRLLRTCGLLRDIAQSRAQIFLITAVITLFAYRLVSASGWPKLVGMIWMAALIANLLAAALLAVSRAKTR